MSSVRIAIVILGCLALAGCAAVSTQDEKPTIHEEVQEVRPASPEARSKQLLSSAREYVKRYQEGKNVRDLDRALDALRDAKRLVPDDPIVNVMLYGVLADKATAQLDDGLLDELRASYDMAFQQAPTLARDLPHPAFVAAVLYWHISAREGLSTEQEKAYEDKAIKALREAVRERPAHAGAHFMLGRAYYHRDLNELALFEAQEAVQLAPGSADARYLLGNVHSDRVHSDDACYDRASVDAAVRAYKDAVRLAPDSPDAHRRLSDALRHQGQFELAVFEARRAVELDDSARNRLELGEALLAAGHPELAAREQREALKRRPDYAWAQAELALALLAAGVHEEAVDAYKRRMELGDPPSFYMALHYHLALRHLGRSGEARAVLERYADRAEDPWEEHLLTFHLGRLDPEELLANAENECQRSEGHFYTGYQQFLAGDTQGATRRFEENLKADTYCFLETHIAGARLSQLSEPTR